jgi:hypothetical protein
MGAAERGELVPELPYDDSGETPVVQPGSGTHLGFFDGVRSDGAVGKALVNSSNSAYSAGGGEVESTIVTGELRELRAGAAAPASPGSLQPKGCTCAAVRA